LPQSRTPEAIAAEMQSELRRLNCYSGKVGDTWGEQSSRAVERFNKVAGLELPPDAPQETSLGALKGWKGQNCPVEQATVPRAKSRPAAAVTPKKQLTSPPRKASKPAVRKQAATPRPKAAPHDSGSAEINELQRMFPEGAWVKRR
jgi:hypothetical protein